MDFFIPKKSTIGKISMAAMQKIPISFSFVISCFAPRIKLLPCTVTPNAVAHIPGVDPASIFKNDKRFIGKTFSFTVIIYRMCDFTYLCSIGYIGRIGKCVAVFSCIEFKCDVCLTKHCAATEASRMFSRAAQAGHTDHRRNKKQNKQ